MRSPIATFCDTETGMIPQELAGFLNLPNTRYQLLVQGAYDRLPIILKKLADELRGPGGGDRLEADYQAFKNTLSPETKRDLENQLYPAGRWSGLCP